VGGIGITRAAVQERFERPALGFVFEEGSPTGEQPRVIGESANGLAVMELVGPAANLEKASLVAFTPADDIGAVADASVYLLALLAEVAPTWAGGGDWFVKTIAESNESTGSTFETSTVQDGLRMTVRVNKLNSSITLTAEAAP
jgi:hypothetical protein